MKDRTYIDAIFIAHAAGSTMTRVSEIQAIPGLGLEGDRYATGAGYYSRHGDICEITLIEGEVLDEIAINDRMEIRHGEHRRNIVTRGLRLRELQGCRLKIDEVLLEFDRPRPPCSYVERLTELGMTAALGRGAGIGVRVLSGGILKAGAIIEVVAPFPRTLRRLP